MENRKPWPSRTTMCSWSRSATTQWPHGPEGQRLGWLRKPTWNMYLPIWDKWHRQGWYSCTPQVFPLNNSWLYLTVHIVWIDHHSLNTLKAELFIHNSECWNSKMKAAVCLVPSAPSLPGSMLVKWPTFISASVGNTHRPVCWIPDYITTFNLNYSVKCYKPY
jgi:hypothetical protein